MFSVDIEEEKEATVKELLKDSMFLEYIHCLCLCGHVRYLHTCVPIGGEVISGNCSVDKCICTSYKLREDQLQLDSKDVINYFLSKK